MDMEIDKKVFYSAIITSENNYKNNLYDLLTIVPAKPLVLKDDKKYNCDFIPRTDKIYVPKRRPGQKVKTVRDIRSTYENETYAYLTNDLKSQQSYLLKKIRDGCSKNENTVKVAKKILRADAPISRSAWQMLINMNPEDHIYPRQFVLWNSKLIQVNGSYGGNKKIISNYDLANPKLTMKMKKKIIKNSAPNKKKGLLRNSLTIKFKPGPLGKKKFLDDSHQKYHGDIELLELPKVGLVIQPMYGTPLETTITNFFNDVRSEDGTISAKWAEFAVCVLGKHNNSNVELVNSDCITFDLKYKCDQRRILMRKDLDNTCIVPKGINSCNIDRDMTTSQIAIIPEIKDMMDKILDAVEININQDSMFSADDYLQLDMVQNSQTIDTSTLSKDKTKRKYCELGRLDVTVIQLPDNSEGKTNQVCRNAHCSLGCLCDSLKCTYKLKQHCGREECMFDCKCDYSKYISINSLEVDGTDILPGIINIEDEINMRLAKEEQKFHQTVIVTGEKNILFKSEKRHWKSSKKYESFYKNMCLKNVNDKGKGNWELAISVLKLNCENIEPWCMAHNLYKCFCRGKFTESTAPSVPLNIAEDPSPEVLCVDSESSRDKIEKLANINASVKHLIGRRGHQDTCNLDKSMKINSLADKKVINTDKICKTDSGYSCKHPEKQTTQIDANIISKNVNQNKLSENSISWTDNNYYEDKCVSESSDSSDLYCLEYNGTCSRVNAYEGRKYSDGHYKNTNNKIKEMEKNDKKLQLRMRSILNTDSEKEKEHISTNNIEKCPKKRPSAETSSNQKLKVKLLSGANDAVITCHDDGKLKQSHAPTRNLSSDNKLVGWLESNYKLYKKRIDQGLIKTSLEPPKVGKVALYSWDFILSRYRERKNLFLISKQIPYRIFMGVHTRNPFFASCININEIRFADLHKYPQTVKNLLTNATELKDNFCILRGLAHCWELVGSVTKVSKNDENIEEIIDDTSDIESAPLSSYSDIQSSSDEQSSFGCTEYIDNQSKNQIANSSTASSKENQSLTEYLDESESSKWFVMTVENDFSEIRFYKKGFFVKYESIVKAINVARLSGKTVRLSSQKCVDRSNGPQFGVYAIPNTSEYCVFIGPYEINDSLGIETIKSILDVRKIKRTRGFWINTNKIDNLKVIDNPLSFMALNSLENNEAVPLENHFSEDNNTVLMDTAENHHGEHLDETQNNVLHKPGIKKIVKPIKIRKTNGFYHLATDGSLKKISLQSPPKVVSISAPTLTAVLTNVPNFITRGRSVSSSDDASISTENVGSIPNDLLIDKGPQIKISAVYTQKEDSNPSTKKTEKGMFILKPEEINRKLFEGYLNTDVTSPSQSEEIVTESTVAESRLLNDDVENPVGAPHTVVPDVYVISDDEDAAAEVKSDNSLKDVLIKCTSVTDLGCIPGIINCASQSLCFKVAGVISEFYPKEDAFEKLNLALSTIVGASKQFDLEWKIDDSKESEQREVTLLDCEILHRVLGERGEKSSQSDDIVSLASGHAKTYSRKKTTSTSSGSSHSMELNDKTELRESTTAKEKD